LGTTHLNEQAATAHQDNTIPPTISDNLDEYLSPIKDQVQSQLKQHGSTWLAWHNQLSTIHKKISDLLKSEKNEIGALIANNPKKILSAEKWNSPKRPELKTLLFRRELEYLQLQNPNDSIHDPVKAIIAFRDSLSAQGIDFLFIPIPTKLDVYPEWIGGEHSPTIIQPYLSQIRLELANNGVETLDLLTSFLTERGLGLGDSLSLYQRQDTHWTPRGLDIAAQVVAQRIMAYPWFAEAFPLEMKYQIKDTMISQLGDLHERLSPEKRSLFQPEKLNAQQILDSTGHILTEDESSAIVIIGDSYTGVFQQVAPRGAGFSSHLSFHLKAPTDLVMGWGGGPEAPHKLQRRGPEYLKKKKLVVWLMSARDLLTYPGNW
jgi:hypothetical protein